MEGVIFDIKRFAIHDGPGIRTTVFLKGCPLKCFWCHNPESRRKGVENLWSAKEEKYHKLGRKISVEDLMQEVLADKVFYASSNGGVTFSGGEPTLQLDFLEELLMVCKKEGLHTAVDTSGYVLTKGLERILLYTDLFLFDLKMLDAEKHLKYTGVNNDLILKNLDFLLSQGAQIDLRIPLIPKVNDSEMDLEALIEFIHSRDGIQNIHLLPYHRTGQHKYEKFQLKQSEFEVDTPDDKYIHRQMNFFNAHGLQVIHGG